jgi:hypothetical protein
MYESIYLLETRESIKNNENIYKIGRTCQNELKRFNNYPRGSKLHIHISCVNSCEIEKLIIKSFNNQFENVDNYGREYFKGNLLEMINIVLQNISHSFECLSSSDEYCKKLTEVTYNNTQLHNEIHELKNFIDNITKYSTKQKRDYESLLETVNNKKISIEEIDKSYCINIVKNSKNITMYKCKECDFTTKRKFNLQAHIERKHLCKDNITSKNSDLYCEKCNKDFINMYNFKIHTKTCKGKPFECDVCKKPFLNYQSKYYHKNNVICKPAPPPPTNPSLIHQVPPTNPSLIQQCPSLNNNGNNSFGNQLTHCSDFGINTTINNIDKQQHFYFIPHLTKTNERIC